MRISRRALALGLVASASLNIALATYIYLREEPHSRLIRANRDALEAHARSATDGGDKGSHLQYAHTPPELQRSGLRYYWHTDGYVLYVLPRGSGIDDPEEFIIFDTRGRAHSPRTILQMYPQFVLCQIRYMEYPGWYYLQARK